MCYYDEKTQLTFFLHISKVLALNAQQAKIFVVISGDRLFILRMVPTIVMAHTFCASRDTRISYR